MREAVAMTGFSEHAIRKYLKEFNIQLEKTEGGHRRFTPETIEKLRIVGEKKELGWSVKQIAAFFSGEVTSEMLKRDTELKTNLEKKIENLEEKLITSIDERFAILGKIFEGFAQQNEQFKQQLIAELKTEIMKEVRLLQPPVAAAVDVEEQKLEMEAIIKQQRLEELEIKEKLVKEAEEAWNMLPEADRTKGLFTWKTEDFEKKRYFVERYVDAHLLQLLKKIQNE
jgi:DNA-binding transcriptional MerR regulator